jgi:predicted XRE-type DNA-binding protein
MKKNNRIRAEEGSGNVFADLGFPNPECEQLKARLTLQIYRLIKDHRLTQPQAGAILGIKQPHVSGLMRGQSGNFSVERLMDFLTALGQDRARLIPPLPSPQTRAPRCPRTASPIRARAAGRSSQTLS